MAGYQFLGAAREESTAIQTNVTEHMEPCHLRRGEGVYEGLLLSHHCSYDAALRILLSHHRSQIAAHPRQLSRWCAHTAACTPVFVHALLLLATASPCGLHNPSHAVVLTLRLSKHPLEQSCSHTSPACFSLAAALHTTAFPNCCTYALLLYWSFDTGSHTLKLSCCSLLHFCSHGTTIALLLLHISPTIAPSSCYSPAAAFALLFF